MKKKRTHTHPFTLEQIESLRANPHVQSVSTSTVRFTAAFKQLFYEAYSFGKTPREIFQGAGLDPEMLGEDRMEGFRYSVMKSRRHEGISGESENVSAPENTEEVSDPEQKIRALESELTYVKQEVEFLKRLQLANAEAQMSWERKHRQRQNTKSSAQQPAATTTN